jgi:hypothetical protein
MIAAEDLMIGNYLLFDEDGVKTIRQVTTIGEDAEGFKGKYVRLDKAHATTLKGEYLHVEGIPLTPDVLEMLGFEYTGCNFLPSYQNKEFDLIEIEFCGGKVLFIWDAAYTSSPCDYVHQLQILCKSLTGKDLKFKTT